MKILHVTDCLNGGVKDVITEIIKNSHELEHYLLYDVHENDPHELDDLLNMLNNNNSKWEKGYLKRIKHLKSYIKSISPDLVHLHSSRAGFYGRIFISKNKTAYSSHGFGFQRRDINWIFRLTIYIVEIILSFRTKIYIANWPHEYDLAGRFFRKKKLAYAPVIIEALRQERKIVKRKFNEKLQFATIGRIAKAKDPCFFLEVKEIQEKKYDSKWIWYGDGNSSYKNDLEKSNVEISGWLSIDDLKKRIINSDMVLITSLWDAGPITLYLASYLGLPVIIRDFPAGKIFNFDHGFSVNKFCNSIDNLLDIDDIEEFTIDQRNIIDRVANNYKSKEIDRLYRDAGCLR